MLAGRDERAIAVWCGLVVIGLALWMELPAAMAVVLCIMGIGLAFWSPPGATAAIMTALPFVYHLLPIGSQQVSPLELSILAACAGIGGRGIVALSHRGIRQFVCTLVLPLPMSFVAAALVAIGVGSLAFVADPDYLAESVRELRTTVLEPVAVLFLVRWTVRRQGLPMVLIGLFGAGLVAAGDGVAQYVSHSGGVVGDATYRARGPYPHPNNQSLYLERLVMVAAGLLIIRPETRRIGVPVLAVLAGGLALTFSRGALVGVAVGLAVLLLMRRPTRGWVYLGIGLLGVLLAFAGVAGGRLLATGAEGSASTRELIWRSSLRMAADHPLTGVGLDQFLYQYGRRYVDPAGWPERYTSHPHNLVLDVWLRLGVAGLVVFAALAFVVWRMIARVRLEGDLRGAAAAGATAALAAGVAHGLVDNGFFLPDLAVMTWCFIALVEHDTTVGGVGARPWFFRRAHAALVPT